jgi:hemoglobin/transferrin/lactoferrin receptor protein
MELPPFAVNASRFPETFEDAPFVGTVIGEADIDYQLARTFADLLQDEPGVMVQRTAHGQASPFIRGFTGFRTVLLIDGIRVNNSVFRSGPNQYWATLDPFTIERIELVKGPSSVLYGSDAIGGTVQVSTLGTPSTRRERIAGGRLLGRAASAERSLAGRAEADFVVHGSLAGLFGITQRTFGDLRAGDSTGEQPNTGYDEWSADGKLTLFETPERALVAAFQALRQNNVPRAHRTVDAVSFRGTTVGSELRRELDQERYLAYLQYEMTEGDWNGLFSLSWQRQSETRDRVRGDGRRDIRGFDVDTFGAFANFAQTFEGLELAYGAEVYHDLVDSFRDNFDAAGNFTGSDIQGPVGDEASYTLAGAYVQATVPAGEVLTFTGGVRVNYARADVDRFEDPQTGQPASLEDEWLDVVGSLRALARPPRLGGVTLFGGVSQGFRAPNLSDLTRLDTARTNEIETPSPNLDPERYISFEAGARWQNERLSLEAAYFHTLIDDQIIRVPTGNTIGGDNEVTKLNSGEGNLQGVEFTGRWRAHRDWELGANFAWNAGEIETFSSLSSTATPIEEPISRLMPKTFHGWVLYEPAGQNWWLRGALTAADEQDDLSSRDASDTSRIPPAGTPGYVVADLTAGIALTENLTVRGGVENVGDKDYRIHGSGVNAPGRNFILEGELRF